MLYEQSNIQSMIEKENFSTLSFDYYQGEDLKRFQEAVRISLDFVQNFKQDYQNLFFYGTVGTGKLSVRLYRQRAFTAGVVCDLF